MQPELLHPFYISPLGIAHINEMLSLTEEVCVQKTRIANAVQSHN